MVWLTRPPPKWLAAPEATAASWSARVRSSFSETAIGRPSADTTTACATPGTLRTKLVTSQLRFCASLLSCVMVAPGRRWGAVTRLLGLLPAAAGAGRRGAAAACQAATVAGEHAAHLGGRAPPGRRWRRF